MHSGARFYADGTGPFPELCSGQPHVTGPAGKKSRRPFSSTGPYQTLTIMSDVPIGRYARILLDDWFKRTFGQESRLRLLHLFLQELIPEHDIEQITLVNTEHINPVEQKKDVRVDVECTDADGTRFVVEMQLAEQDFFYERAVYNSTLAIQQQKGKGKTDYDFPTVYFVGLMNFTIHLSKDRVDYRYSLREDITGERMTDRIQYIFLELPNCEKKALTPEATVLENFCYALRNMETMTDRPAELKQEIFQLLFDSAEIANFTPEEKAKYDLDMTTERDRLNQLAFAEKKGQEDALRIMVEQLHQQGMDDKDIQTLERAVRTEIKDANRSTNL